MPARARDGWYGGAFTFYSGDVIETLPRESKTHSNGTCSPATPTGSGNHVFLDTQARVAYGNFDGNRTLIVGDQGREAERQARRPDGRAGRQHRRCSSITAAVRSCRISAWTA